MMAELPIHVSELPAQPDVMNDPSFETNSKGKRRSVDEADTCRICRGEGSNEEPLFYPCKCSGSIKFVHQECLMEWLSHSQKKHCELCKTSFRFTKLYDPKMPSSVPIPVFLRQAMVHTLKSLVTWARWHLVAFVWLGWVPWCMRTVWRGLFWIGDGGWVDWQEMERQSNSTIQRRLDEIALMNATNARRELLSTTDSAPADVVSWFFRAFTPSSPISQTLNFTAGDPILYNFAKRFFHGILYYNSIGIVSSNSTLPDSTKVHQASQRSPSWLSDMSFLQSLTPWTTINNLVIDVFEGQIITLFVCVAFILIFLIREWVVQQQPGINMGAVANGLAAAERRRGLAEGEDVQQHPENRAEELLPALPPPRDGNVAHQDRETNPTNSSYPAGSQSQPVMTMGETTTGGSRSPLGESVQGAVEVDTNESIFGPFHSSVESTDDTSEAGPSSPGQRPGLLTRDALTLATQIQRTLEEGSEFADVDWSTLEETNKRENSSSDETSRVIVGEGQNRELSRLVSKLEKIDSVPSEERSGIKSTDADAGGSSRDEGAGSEFHSDASNESWQEVIGFLGQPSIDPSSTVQKAIEDKNRPEKAAERPPKDDIPLLTEIPLGLGNETSANDKRLDKGKAREIQQPETSPSDAGNIANDELSLSGVASPTEVNTAVKDYLSSNREAASGEETDVDFPKIQVGIPQEIESILGANLASVKQNGAQHIIDQNPSSTLDLDSQLGLEDNSQPSQVLEQSQGAAGTSEPQASTNAPVDLSENVMDWLWGGITEVATPATERGEDDERVVENVANEAPFVPMANGQLMIANGNAAENPGQDPEVLRAAAEAGVNLNEQEVVEDGEDLEGIMELIGMQGPLAGLVQNGMFSAVLISMTVFFGIWVPYVTGKIFLVLLANPVSLLVKLPLRWASIFADFIIDSCVFATACVIYWVDSFRRLITTPVGWVFPFVARMSENRLVAENARVFAQNAMERLGKLFVASGDSLSDSDVPVFSIVAHESLRTIEQRLRDILKFALSLMLGCCERFSSGNLNTSNAWKSLWHATLVFIQSFATSITQRAYQAVMIVPVVLRINPLRIALDIPQRAHPLDYSLAQWNTKDRIFAIVLGYLAFSVIGALYLKAKTTLRENRNGEKVEGVAAEALLQAGGVMKVILIISIEMIVFPLYCGLLLDVALLPLFENASATSRLQFAVTSPSTSLFVHWFVGTCYMFHFALFVAMCRKIMRRGVLCKMICTTLQIL